MHVHGGYLIFSREAIHPVCFRSHDGWKRILSRRSCVYVCQSVYTWWMASVCTACRLAVNKGGWPLLFYRLLTGLMVAANFCVGEYHGTSCASTIPMHPPVRIWPRQDQGLRATATCTVSMVRAPTADMDLWHALTWVGTVGARDGEEAIQAAGLRVIAKADARAVDEGGLAAIAARSSKPDRDAPLVSRDRGLLHVAWHKRSTVTRAECALHGACARSSAVAEGYFVHVTPAAERWRMRARL